MAREREVKVKILGDASGAQRALSSVGKGTSRFGSIMKGVGKAALIGGAAVGAGLVVAGKAAVDAAIEAEKVAAQTDAALKSTGGAANVTAEDISGLAQEIMGYSGMSDEAVQSAENLLLTFTKVRNEAGKGNDIFDQATRSIADMSVALGKDLQSATTMVGKALNDPIAGISAMSRAGVQFTEEQKEQIATLVESGETMKAQKVILKELETQFGGSAKAIGETTEGQFNIAKESIGNFLEVIGAQLLPIIADVAKEIAEFVSSKGFQQWFQSAVEWVKNAAQAIGRIAGPVIGGLIAAVKKVSEWLGNVFGAGGAGREAVSGFAKWWAGIWPQVKEIVKNVFNAIKAFWKEWGGAITQVLKGVFQVIKGIFETVLAILRGDWKKAWDGMKQILAGVWEAIKGLVRAGVKAVVEIAKGLWTGIKAAASAVFNWFKALPGRIVSAVGDLGMLLYNAGRDVMWGLLRGMMSMGASVLDWLDGLTGKMAQHKGPPAKDRKLLYGAGVDVMRGLQRGLASEESKVLGQLDSLTKRMGQGGGAAGVAGAGPQGQQVFKVDLVNGVGWFETQMNAVIARKAAV